MDCDIALKYLKEEFRIALNPAQETVFRGAWEGRTYDQIALESPDFPNVKYLANDIGPNLWQMLSELLKSDENIKITKGNFRAIIEARLSQAREASHVIVESNLTQKPQRPIIDWGEAPNISMIPIYGERQEQVNELKNLVTNYQLVTLIGLNGIGKTTVAVKLLEKLLDQQEFELIIWRSLSYNPPPKLDKILNDILSFLEVIDTNNQEEIELNQQISSLINVLRRKRCLLVLDHLEYLMQKDHAAGHYQKEYDNYRTLLERLGKERHQSCLLVITQEKPDEVIQMEERGFVATSYIVRGLKEDIKKNFQNYGLLDSDKWDDLIDIFKGHPFALQNIANKIKHLFGGSVKDYLKENTINLRDINEMLEQEITILSDLEKKILFFLSLLSSQENLSFSELKQKLITLEDLKDLSGSDLQDVLESLLQRSLISGDKKYLIDPIVKKFITNRVLLSRSKVTDKLENINDEQVFETDNQEDNIKRLEELFQKS